MPPRPSKPRPSSASDVEIPLPDAVRILGAHPATIRRRAREGMLPGVVNRASAGALRPRWYISPAKLAAYINSVPRAN
jgi:hypothetical protein